MKKFLCFAVMIVFAFACKKNGPGKGSGLLLSKVFTDGLIEQEYIYSADGKLVRDNTYVIGVGQSTLGFVRTYEYNADGSLKELTCVQQNYGPLYRRVFTWSAQGRVSRVDEASVFHGDDDLNNMDFFELYEYDNKAQLTRVWVKWTNQTMVVRHDFSYDNIGNLVLWKAYRPDNGLKLKQKMEIVPRTPQLPAHWKKYLVMPRDFNMYELFIEKQTYTSYFVMPAGAVTKYTYPQREYNSQGYVVSETFKVEENGNTTTKERTYEYVQQ